MQAGSYFSGRELHLNLPLPVARGKMCLLVFLLQVASALADTSPLLRQGGNPESRAASREGADDIFKL